MLYSALLTSLCLTATLGQPAVQAAEQPHGMNTVVLKGGEKDQVSKDPAKLIKCDGTPAKPIWFPARIFTEYGRANFGEEDKGKMLNELCNAQVTLSIYDFNTKPVPAPTNINYTVTGIYTGASNEMDNPFLVENWDDYSHLIKDGAHDQSPLVGWLANFKSDFFNSFMASESSVLAAQETAA